MTHLGCLATAVVLSKCYAAGKRQDTVLAFTGAMLVAGKSEEDVLRWLGKEYDVAYTSLEDVEPDRQLLSLFPARMLLKDELLPLRRVNGCVEVATSRLFATQGLDTLKTMTGLRLKPVLAPTEAIQRDGKCGGANLGRRGRIVALAGGRRNGWRQRFGRERRGER